MRQSAQESLSIAVSSHALPRSQQAHRFGVQGGGHLAPQDAAIDQEQAHQDPISRRPAESPYSQCVRQRHRLDQHRGSGAVLLAEGSRSVQEYHQIQRWRLRVSDVHRLGEATADQDEA